jgi:cation:H+ antiporter
VFFAWLAVSIGQALRARHAAPEVLGVEQTPRALLDAALGLLLLAVAGRLVVVAAHGMGQTLGLDQFVVGATLVAFGTSTPEIATVIVSRLRHHDEVGVGTIVGSNIFNSLWVVGIVALIQPFEVRGPGVALGLGASVVVALALIPWPSSVLGRRRGIALIVGYLAYATLLFLVPSSTAA